MNDAPPSGYRIESALAAWQSARARLLNEDPSLEGDEAALVELLGPEDGQIEDVLARLLRAAVHAEAMEEAASEQEKKIAGRKKRYKQRGQSLRGTAFSIMDAIGQRKVELGDLTASITAGRRSLQMFNEDAIPDIYVEVVTLRKPDTATITSVIKSGGEVPGCQLANGFETLMIRTR